MGPKRRRPVTSTSIPGEKLSKHHQGMSKMNPMQLSSTQGSSTLQSSVQWASVKQNSAQGSSVKQNSEQGTSVKQNSAQGSSVNQNSAQGSSGQQSHAHGSSGQQRCSHGSSGQKDSAQGSSGQQNIAKKFYSTPNGKFQGSRKNTNERVTHHHKKSRNVGGSHNVHDGQQSRVHYSRNEREGTREAYKHGNRHQDSKVRGAQTHEREAYFQRRSRDKSYASRQHHRRHRYHQNNAKQEREHGKDQPNLANHQSTDGTNCDIPGFYYDAEKKKYFKILPGQNQNSSVVTRDNVKKKISENIRQEKLRDLLFPLEKGGQKKTFCANSPHSLQCKNIHRSLFSHNIFDIIEGIRLGNIKSKPPSTIENVHINQQISSFRPRGKCKVFPEPGSMYEKLDNFKVMIPSSDYKRLLCLWSLKGVVVQRVQMLDIDSLKRCDEDGSVKVEAKPTANILLQHHSKVTNICWAPPGPGHQNEDCQIMFTTTCFLGTNPSLALLRKMDSDSTDMEMFNLGNVTTWTCAWNAFKHQFSVGTDESGLILDVATRRMWELHTRGSQVYSQAFSPQEGSMLYSGTKKGMILGHDLRSISTWSTLHLGHKSPLSHLLPTQDGLYLLASDFSGKLVKWDMRQRRIVTSFQGNYNEYTSIPFQLDPSQRILYAAGQDCYTRLWNTQTGDLLHTLPPPYPASRDSIPTLCLVPLNQMDSSMPGMLMGTHDEVHFYSV